MVTQIPNVLHKMTPETEEREIECMFTAGFWELRIPNSQHHFEERCILGISEIESVQGIHMQTESSIAVASEMLRNWVEG